MNSRLEETYADAYIQYMGIVHHKSEPNRRAYEKEAQLCYNNPSKEVKMVDALLPGIVSFSQV